MDGKGAWTDNIFTERFWRSLKYEEVYVRTYDTVADAKQWIYRFIERYNTIRPHSSIRGKTPYEIHAITPAEGLHKASQDDQSIYISCNRTCSTKRTINTIALEVSLPKDQLPSAIELIDCRH